MKPHQHSIVYDNCLSSWDEALPLGNGHFGGMVYLTARELVVAVNHYDVYYRILPRYGAKARESSSGAQRTRSYPYTLEDIRSRALAAHEDPDSPAHNNYNLVFMPERADIYGVNRKGSAQPLTAELRVRFAPAALPLRGFRQLLDIGTGTYLLEEPRVTIRLLFSSEDVMLLTIEQSGPGIVESVRVSVPERRLMERVTSYAAREEADASILSFRSSFHSWGDDPARHEPFSYGWVTRVSGAAGTARCDQGGAEYRVDPARQPGCTLTVLACPEFSPDPSAWEARLVDAARRLPAMGRAHEERWASFWSRSSISIPDPFLEQLWHVNLYALACANGEGAVLHEQACGLNGLWDIVQPSQWGSAWYWDVNIEQGFWPIYTANHLELGEAFYRGLLSHVEDAERHARDFYGMSGIAGDCPFTLYLSIWPWCCQYFAWHYAYSGDVDFLRDRAYPLFVRVLEFFEQYLSWEPVSQQYAVFPDVSPEQGPVTRNSTITVSCLKYLLSSAIEASRILSVDLQRRAKWEHMRDHLPPYAIEDSIRYGRHIRDSEWAEPDTYMAHSSPLMPIYPIGELTPKSADPAILGNTLRYMEREQNLGTHNFGWLACAWARLGDGDQVLRMLYHLGVAFQLRTNGLFAEQTERWMQNCLTACDPVYSPPLVEAGSATAAAVSEMLLQSHGGLIRLFPAVPTGGLRLDAERKFDQVMGAGQQSVAPWTECSFDRLLAEGAFEVSAAMREGRVSRCVIRSLRGKPVRMANPFQAPLVRREGSETRVPARASDGVLQFETVAGESYVVGETSAVVEPAAAAGAADPSVKVTVAPTSRRVTIGKSPQTEVFRALDSATFDYFAGDQRVSPVSVYRLDFSTPGVARDKCYADVLAKQFHGCGKMGLDFKAVTAETSYRPSLGYGWKDVRHLEYVDRGGPDPFRRDFVGSTDPADFLVELPEGAYRVLLLCGDCGGRVSVRIELDCGVRWSSGRALDAGEFAVPILSVDHHGGLLRARFDSEPGLRWAVNAVIVNRAP